MALKLEITPQGKIIGAMPHEEQSRTPVLLGLDAEVVKSEVKLLVNVPFRRIQVKAPLSLGTALYVAATEAQVTLRANGAKIVAHGKKRSILVEHNLQRKKGKKLGAKLEPTIEVSDLVSVKLLSAEAERDMSEEHIKKYTLPEDTLTAVPFGDSIEWVRQDPRSDKAIRDYILENLELWAKCDWSGHKKCGSIELRTSIGFFNKSGSKMNIVKAFVLGATLSTKPEIMNKDGMRVEFTCEDA